MEYQEAFMPYEMRHGIQRSDYGTSRNFYGIPKKQLWNTKYFLWNTKKLDFLWNTKKLPCNNKKLIVHSPEYHEVFSEYQEAFLWNTQEVVMECQETLSQRSYCGHQEVLKWNTKKQLRNNK